MFLQYSAKLLSRPASPLIAAVALSLTTNYDWLLSLLPSKSHRYSFSAAIPATAPNPLAASRAVPLETEVFLVAQGASTH